MDMFTGLVILFIGLAFMLVLYAFAQTRNGSREASSTVTDKVSAPAVSASTANVDMTPPALQQSNAAAPTVIASRPRRTLSALSAGALKSVVALASAASKVTARVRTVSGYQAQWYSVPGVKLRQPGEPCAVRRTDTKSKRTASRLRREYIAAYRQAEGQRQQQLDMAAEIAALEEHLLATGIA